MRWLLPILIFDAVIIAMLLTRGVEEDRADLVFASTSEHNNLDPQQLSWSHDIRIVENLFEPLVKIKIPELTPEPGAAESWSVSDDKTVYTFKIRPDAKWSNGDTVKSTDFTYAWRRALLPDLAADYTQLLWVIKGAEDFFNWRNKQLEAYALAGVKDNLETVASALKDYPRMKTFLPPMSDTMVYLGGFAPADPMEAYRGTLAALLTKVDERVALYLDYAPNPRLAKMRVVEDAARLVLDETKHAEAIRLVEQALTEYRAAKDEGSIQSAEVAELFRKGAYERFQKEVGLQTPDDKTLIVTLEQPVAYFLELAAFITWVPVHEKTCDAQTTMNPETGRLTQDPYWVRPVEAEAKGKPALVCNGPYVLQRRRFRRDLLLVANKMFRDYDKMGNHSVLEKIIPDGQAQYLQFTRGEVDWIPVFSGGQMGPELLRQRIALERLKEFTSPVDGKELVKELPTRDFVHPVPSAGTYYYMFNCNEKLLDGTPNALHDPRVRLALSLAIDRDRIVTAVTRLNQPVATTFVPPGSLPGYDAPTDAGVLFDPERARKVLADAGYPGGKGLTGLSILYNTGGEHEGVAQAISYMWKQHLNVDIPAKGVEVKALSEAHKHQDYSITRAGWFGDYLDPTTFLDKFLTENGNNDGKYSSAKFDALMKNAAKELDPKKRMTILREAETIMLQDAAIAPIYQYLTIDLYDPAKVKNMHLNPWGFRRTENVVVDRDAKE